VWVELRLADARDVPYIHSLIHQAEIKLLTSPRYRVAYWKKLDRFLLAPASDAPCRTDQLVVVHLGVESHGVARLLPTGCVRKVLGDAFGRGPRSAVVAEEDGASMELVGVPI
jgi:hypothetical protein